MIPSKTPYEVVKPTAEELEKIASRMRSLIEFLEMNNIIPSEAVPIAMHFITCTCRHYVDKDTLLAMFKIMVDDVYDDKGLG